MTKKKIILCWCPVFMLGVGVLSNILYELWPRFAQEYNHHLTALKPQPISNPVPSPSH